MQYNKYTSECVLCPCYMHHNRNAIYCLPIAGADAVVTTFSNSADRKSYMACHCYPSGTSARCALFSVLFRHQEEKEDGQKKELSSEGPV